MNTVPKRAIKIGDRITSVSLEDGFWDGLKDIARHHGVTLSELVSEIDVARQDPNLSSAIRSFVLNFYREKVRRVRGGGGRDLSSITLADLLKGI